MRVNDGRVRVGRLPGERLRSDLVIPTVQAGGGSVLVWGAIWGDGRHVFCIVPATVNAVVYRRILEQFLHRYSDRLPENWILQDDNAPPHRAHIVDEFKRDAGIRSLPWPARSPHLNPIEHVWDYLGRRVQEQQLPAANAAELSDRLRGAWREMPFDFVRKLIASMTRRVEAVVLARGGHTRY